MNLSGLQLPSQKTWAAGIGGLLGWAISLALLYLAHWDIGLQGQGALVILCSAAITKIVPPSKQDVLAHINDEIAQAGTLIGKLTPASDSGAPVTTAAANLAAKVG